MHKIYQTMFGDNGNCLQACVASLLELKLDQVPHFASYGEDWWFVFRDFLAKYNINPIYTFNFTPVGSWHIASVYSPRFENTTHAVICDPNGNIVHDPHPEVTDYSINGKPIGWYWLVPIDPAKMVNFNE